MSDNTQTGSGSEKRLTRAAIIEMLAKNFESLPDIDKNFFNYGPLYLGGNAGLAGLISNSLYRRALNVKKAPLASGLPMAVLPFLTTFALYRALVSIPLMSGDLNCPSCALLRGAVVGVVGGGVYPILLALPVNIGLASLYSSAPLPQKGNVLRYWVDLSRPIVRRMRAVLVLQAFFGVFLSSRDFESYIKLAQITFGSMGEELKD